MGHSLQPSRSPCAKPCQTKSLAVMAMVSVSAGKYDAAVRARVPVVEAPAMPTFRFPWAVSQAMAASTHSLFL